MKIKVLLALSCVLLSAGIAGAQQYGDFDDEDGYFETPDAVVTDGVLPDGGGMEASPPINEQYGQPDLPSSPTVRQLIEGIAKAERTNDANSLVYAYGEAVRDSGLVRGALTRLMYDYYRARAAATYPEEATQAANEASIRFQVFQAAQLTTASQQNQRIIEQNAQIIKQNQEIIQLLRQRNGR